MRLAFLVFFSLLIAGESPGQSIAGMNMFPPDQRALRSLIVASPIAPASVWRYGMNDLSQGINLASPILAEADSLPSGMPFHTRMLWGRKGLFRITGLAPSNRQAELRTRSTMLQWHQRLGLLTFGAMTTQVILGELIAADRSRYYEDLQPVHRTLGYATFGTYMTTASLSLLAPPAYRYSEGFNSVRLHRWLAIIHFAGMAAQPWLGRSLSNARSSEQYDERLNRHQWIGRVTYAAFTTAILSVFLPY